MAKPPRTQPIEALNWLDILHEMDHGDDRTAAVVGASFLENNLAIAISARLKELTSAQRKAIFDDDRAPLGSFSAKIEIGFALNLFDEDVKHDLDGIRRVRNCFAHRLDVRNFDHNDVRADCDNLRGPTYHSWVESKGKPEVSKRRQRYLNTASHLTARFDLERKHIYRPPDAAVQTYETAPRPSFGKPG